MSIKIACYGVRPNEKPFFNGLNIYGYDLTLIEDLLTHENIDTAKGHDAVLLRGNCVADKENLKKLYEYGVRYVFTRTVGTNHIDIPMCKKLGIKVAFVPAYSPNAIAELALTLALMLLRNTAYTTMRTSQKNFIVDETMFSKEIRNCTVGIIGTGKIGMTEAKLYNGLGAKVLGYDIYESDDAAEVLEYTTLDRLLKESDIVSIHVPYIKGENEKMIDSTFLSKMKKGSILVNTARGELQDNEAILEFLQSGHLAGFGTDVFSNEQLFFFRSFDEGELFPDQVVEKLIRLYPRVLVTPHIGSNTDEALSNMISISYKNFFDIMNGQMCENQVC